MIIEKLLGQVGMNDNQIAIYLKVLQYGKTNASSVASSLARERTSTLKLMQSMVSIGYLSESKEGLTTYFHALPFSILEEQFMKKLQESQDILKQKDLIKHELESLSNKHLDMTCKIQDGMNAISYLYQTISYIINNQKLRHISCIAEASFEQMINYNTEIGNHTLHFCKQLKEQKVVVVSYLGKGMNLMEQLSIHKEIDIISELSNNNGTTQLWLVGSDVFIILYKRNPQVIHIHSHSFANLLHFICEQLEKVVIH